MRARAGGAHGWQCVSPLYRCTGVYQASPDVTKSGHEPDFTGNMD
jgi:hypothetical protein